MSERKKALEYAVKCMKELITGEENTHNYLVTIAIDEIETLFAAPTCAWSEINRTLESATNEGTRAPYWLILDPDQNMRCSVHGLAGQISGPFFSREDAELYLKNRRYNYGRRARVYCLSGYHSRKYNTVCDALGKICFYCEYYRTTGKLYNEPKCIKHSKTVWAQTESCKDYHPRGFVK